VVVSYLLMSRLLYSAGKKTTPVFLSKISCFNDRADLELESQSESN
jgi:hypothetical protein